MRNVAATGQFSFSTAMSKLAKITLKNSTAQNALFGTENMIMTESQYIKKTRGSRMSGKSLFPQQTV